MDGSEYSGKRGRPNPRRLDLQKAQEIRRKYRNKERTRMHLASDYGVSKDTIYNVINEKYWIVI